SRGRCARPAPPGSARSMNGPTVGAKESVEPETRMGAGRPRLRRPPRDTDRSVARPRAPARFTLASGASPPRRGANEVVRAPATDRAGGEVSVAAVDRPDGKQPRAREGAPPALLAVGVERRRRHHLVAHGDSDRAGRRAAPRRAAPEERAEDR